MMKKINLGWLVAFLLMMRHSDCFGHDTPIHEAITQSAALSSSGLSAFLVSQYGSANAPFLKEPEITEIISDPGSGSSFQSPISWMKSGSRTEDNFPRYKNHFYDPTKNPPIGLTDGVNGFGIASFTWATAPNGGGFAYPNNDTWMDARDYEWAALTNSARVVRGYNTAHMLYTLGRILHLNQDLSQPDHVRNDNHTTLPIVGWHPFGPSWIEPYGLANYVNHPEWFPLRARGWPSWLGGGFTKLEDFWSRHLYTNNASALNNDANNTGPQLGLAEFSNGNFLGENALYAEFYRTNEIRHFAFPSLLTSTTFAALKTKYSTGTTASVLKNGNSIFRIRISKTNDGIFATNHSVIRYLASKIPSKLTTIAGVASMTTIDDAKVLQEYHSILLPKAVEYSAGILDYFFRGTMSVARTGYDSSLSRYTNSIMNTSGQDFSAGTFSLYADNTNGDRTLVTNFAGALPSGASTNIVFPGPAVSTNQLLLVYKGTIGTNGTGGALDPVDGGIAIAVQRVPLGPIVWWPADGNANDIVGGNNGTPENVSFTPGQIGQAFAFDPEDFDIYSFVGINVSDSPAFALTNALSIEGWIRPRGDGYTIFYRGDNRSGLDPYTLSMGGTNSLIFQICGADGTTTNVQTTLAYNVWAHVAATFDSGLMSLYVNGVLVAQNTTSVRPLANLLPDAEPGIGIGNTADEDVYNEPFYGDIDQISLYSRALSADEVQAIYNAGLAGKNYY